MPRIQVDTKELKAFGKALRTADKEIRTELFKAVQSATKPIKEEIKAEAILTLPERGGLGTWVSKIGIRTRQAFSGRNVGITITGTLNNKAKAAGRGRGRRKAKTFGKVADLRAINRGRVMHPVFGKGPMVGPQMVRAGFWNRPLETLTAVRAQKEIQDAMKRAVAQIAARVRSAA